MSKCDFSPRLSAYHDGELPEEERCKVEAHVRACGVCADELQRIRGISSALTGMPFPELSQAALARIHQAITTADDWSMVWMARRLAVVGLVLFLSGTVFFWRTSATTESGFASEQKWETIAVARADAFSLDQGEVVAAQWLIEDLSRENKQ